MRSFEFHYIVARLFPSLNIMGGRYLFILVTYIKSLMFCDILGMTCNRHNFILTEAYSKAK